MLPSWAHVVPSAVLQSCADTEAKKSELVVQKRRAKATILDRPSGQTEAELLPLMLAMEGASVASFGSLFARPRDAIAPAIVQLYDSVTFFPKEKLIEMHPIPKGRRGRALARERSRRRPKAALVSA